MPFLKLSQAILMPLRPWRRRRCSLPSRVLGAQEAEDCGYTGSTDDSVCHSFTSGGFTSGGALVKPSWLGRPTHRLRCAALVAWSVGSLGPHFCGPCNVIKGNR